MLIPYNLIQPYVGDLRWVLHRLLETEFAHVIGHLFIFSVLVTILLVGFQVPLNRRTAVLMVGVVLAVGLGQEYFQLQVKGRGFGFPEVFDLGVDLVGGALGWQISRWLQHYARYLRMAYFMLKNA